jgi:hypothetical protein
MTIDAGDLTSAMSAASRNSSRGRRRLGQVPEGMQGGQGVI